VDFSCTLGAGARGVNECKGSFLFDGTIHGKTGTYRADMFDWIAGSEDASSSRLEETFSATKLGERSEPLSASSNSR